MLQAAQFFIPKTPHTCPDSRYQKAWSEGDCTSCLAQADLGRENTLVILLILLWH